MCWQLCSSGSPSHCWCTCSSIHFTVLESVVPQLVVLNCNRSNVGHCCSWVDLLHCDKPHFLAPNANNGSKKREGICCALPCPPLPSPVPHVVLIIHFVLLVYFLGSSLFSSSISFCKVISTQTYFMQALIDSAASFLCESVEANWAPLVVKDCPPV